MLSFISNITENVQSKVIIISLLRNICLWSWTSYHHWAIVWTRLGGVEWGRHVSWQHFCSWVSDIWQKLLLAKHGCIFFWKILIFPKPVLCVVLEILIFPQNFSQKLGYFQKKWEKFAKNEEKLQKSKTVNKK